MLRDINHVEKIKMKISRMLRDINYVENIKINIMMLSSRRGVRKFGNEIRQS